MNHYESGKRAALAEAAEMCRRRGDWVMDARGRGVGAWMPEHVMELFEELADDIESICTTVHPDPQSGEKPEPNGANMIDRADGRVEGEES